MTTAFRRLPENAAKTDNRQCLRTGADNACTDDARIAAKTLRRPAHNLQPCSSRIAVVGIIVNEMLGFVERFPTGLPVRASGGKRMAFIGTDISGL